MRWHRNGVEWKIFSPMRLRRAVCPTLLVSFLGFLASSHVAGNFLRTKDASREI